MKQTSKWTRAIIGALCVLVLVGVVMLALYLDSLRPDPVFGVFHPDPQPEENVTSTTAGMTGSTTTTTLPDNDDEQQGGENNDEPLPPPEELPPVIEIPTVEDPQTGEQGISFPCQVPGYELTIEKLAPYKGMYVEDGTNATVENVAMLLVSNNGAHPIEYAQIAVQYGTETLIFDISALPAGEKLVAQEANGKSAPEGKADKTTAMILRRANLEMSRDKVQVTDNGDNTLTIRNTTGEMIPTVRVFYKYYMKDEDVFVGGIAFTVRITRLEANAAITIHPSHYSSKTGRVVMVMTYDSEV